jgi:hypothetical protein
MSRWPVVIPIDHRHSLPIFSWNRLPQPENPGRAIGLDDSERRLLLRVGWNAFGGLYDLSSRGHKIIQTGTGDDYCVAAAMRLFRDSHEAATLVFSEFYEEMLTLDL